MRLYNRNIIINKNDLTLVKIFIRAGNGIPDWNSDWNSDWNPDLVRFPASHR